MRRDLEEIVAQAAKAGLYTNLITAGVLLDARAAGGAGRARPRPRADLDPGRATPATPTASRTIGAATRRSCEVAGWVRALGLPLTINAPMHRQNIDQLPAIIELAVELGARRLEVAHVQYYGWALQNRQALMPTRAQVLDSAELVEAARERLKGILVIDFVVPDYYASGPKPCMGGWGRGSINITPSGKALPCHAAETIPGLAFDNVREQRCATSGCIRRAFQRFRGTAWMPEPCRSCERREVDWGGCRCQALAFAGDARSPIRLAPSRRGTSNSSKPPTQILPCRLRTSSIASPRRTGNCKIDRVREGEGRRVSVVAVSRAADVVKNRRLSCAI